MPQASTGSGWFIRLLAAALVAVLIGGSASGQGRRNGEMRPRPQEYRGFGPPPPPGFEIKTEAVAKDGYVFVDGEYVSWPYELKLTESGLTINGRELTCQPPRRDFGRGGFGPPRGGDQRGGEQRSGEQRGADQPWRRMVSVLDGELNSGGVIFSFAGQPMIEFDRSTAYDLFKAITPREGRSLSQVAVAEKLPTDFDRKVWDDWISTFVMPDDLRRRTGALIASFDEAQREAEADIAATRWLNRLTYPLLLCGMVTSVLAIGHLLGGRPHAGQSTVGTDESPAMIRALEWSMLFAVVFSILDLTWTILHANAGQMSELNPIGSLLLKDPRQLSGLKLGITLPCLGLIWLLRRNKRAQVAAWWICLILTLVTARWVLITGAWAEA